MALDDKLREATPPSPGASCPACGRPWLDPSRKRAPGPWPVRWPELLLSAIGLYLALTFGFRTVGDYPRAVRDTAIVRVTSECLARTGGRADCAPSSVAPDGSIDVSILADQARATKQKLGGDLLGMAGGVASVLIALAAVRGRPRQSGIRNSVQVQM